MVNSVTLVRIGEETDLGRRNILEIYSGNKPIHLTRMSSITAVDNTVLITAVILAPVPDQLQTSTRKKIGAGTSFRMD